MDEELRQEFAAIRRDFAAMLQSMRQEMLTRQDLDMMREDMRKEMLTRQDLDMMREDMRKENAAEHAQTRQLFAAAVVDMRRHFDVTAEHIGERIDTAIEAVGLLDGKLDRQGARIESTMDVAFADTQALIRFIATR